MSRQHGSGHWDTDVIRQVVRRISRFLAFGRMIRIKTDVRQLPKCEPLIAIPPTQTVEVAIRAVIPLTDVVLKARPGTARHRPMQLVRQDVGLGSFGRK